MSDQTGAPPAELRAILQSLQDDSPLMIALFDGEDCLRYANAAFRGAYALAPDAGPSWTELMRHCHATGHGGLIETDDIEAWLLATGARRGKLPYLAFDAELGDGRWIWMTETRQTQGWTLCVASDITALRHEGRAPRQPALRAAAAAQTDALTGLDNQRRGMQLLQDALAQGETWPLSVAVLELDDPDREAADDRVIVDLARQLQASTRREDGCARFEASRFLLVLPATALPQGVAITERLLARVRRARPLAAERGYSCSVGVTEAVWGESAEQLLRRAEAAMARARAGGGDRLERAEPAGA